MLEWLTNDPIGFAIFALLRNLLYLLVATGILFGLMRLMFSWMNKSIGITFKEHVWDELKKGNLSVAIYFGARVAAVIIGGSLIASAFIQ